MPTGAEREPTGARDPAAARATPCSTSRRSTACRRRCLTAAELAGVGPSDEAEELLIDASGADIRHGGFKAFYRRAATTIQLPPRHDVRDGGGLLRHDACTSWCTGRRTRPGCDRQLSRPLRRRGLRGGGADRRDGLGVPLRALPDRRRSCSTRATSVDWLRVLRADKRAIFVAGTKAQTRGGLPARPLHRRPVGGGSPRRLTHPALTPETATAHPRGRCISTLRKEQPMTQDQIIQRALKILDGAHAHRAGAGVTRRRARLPAAAAARPRARSVRLRVPRRPAPGDRERRAVPRHAGPDQRLPARSGEGGAGAQRGRGDLRPQPPVRRGRAEPGRRAAHPGAEAGAGAGRRPRPRPLRRRRRPAAVSFAERGLL